MLPESSWLDLVLEHLIDLGGGTASHLGQDVPTNNTRQNANSPEAEVEQSQSYNSHCAHVPDLRGVIDLQESSPDVPCLEHEGNSIVEHDAEQE